MRFLLVLFYVCKVTHIYAQDYIDIASFSAVHSPNNAEGNTLERVNISETYTTIRLPLVLKNKDIVIVGMSGTSLSFHKRYEPLHSNKFYTGTLQLGYTKKWNERFQTLVMALPKVSSDFDDISSRDFQIGGILLCTFIKNEKFKYKLGAYYNHEYFGPLILPIIGLDWRPSEKTSVFGNLPINFTIDRKLSNRFSAGLYFQAINMSYRLSERYNHQYLQKYSQELSLYLDTYLASKIVLTLKAGRSIGRSYHFYDENQRHVARSMFLSIGERNLPLNDEIRDGFLFEMKLAYRVSIKKKAVVEEE